MESVVKNGSVSGTSDVQQVAHGVFRLRILFVNVYFIQHDDDHKKWILVDAGIPGYAEYIKKAAESQFGEGSKPIAIVLTHGHFDHVGSLKDLLVLWGHIPVYAHNLEFPYLTGLSSYPPADPLVGGGAMALLSFVFPNKPIDIKNHLKEINDEHIDILPGWKIIHTPGHAPGHISLFRESDKTLLSGDAFVTVKQESVYAIIKQREEVNGPPAYFTSDWEKAHTSVKKLAKLKPHIVAAGHGTPMHGKEMQLQLEHLAKNFIVEVVPNWGRYVKHPALSDKRGIAYLPPSQVDTKTKVIIGVSLSVLAGCLAYYFVTNTKKR